MDREKMNEGSQEPEGGDEPRPDALKKLLENIVPLEDLTPEEREKYIRQYKEWVNQKVAEAEKAPPGWGKGFLDEVKEMIKKEKREKKIRDIEKN